MADLTKRPEKQEHSLKANPRETLNERADTVGMSGDSQPSRPANERLLRRPEVEACTGLSRSTLYAWMKTGDFPQPIKLGARIVAWRERDITEWLETRQQREV